MSREIKFRIWDGKNMYYESNIQNTPYCLMLKLDGKLIDMACSRDEVKTDFKLMQYTGLKDKNGTEMYEGDIVQVIGEGNYTIIYNDANARFDLEWHKAYSYEFVPNDEDIEVIGNIYQNP